MTKFESVTSYLDDEDRRREALLSGLQEYAEVYDIGDGLIEYRLRAPDIMSDHLGLTPDRINTATGRWLAVGMRRLGWERKVRRVTEYVRREPKKLNTVN